MVPWVGLQCVVVVFPDHTHFSNPKKFTHIIIFLNLYITVRVVLPLVVLEEALMVKSLCK